MTTSTNYSTRHKWVKRRFVKTGVCFSCREEKTTEWANLDHQYDLDRRGWEELCHACHFEFDLVLNISPAKTHCGRGHDFSVYGRRRLGGHRYCKECYREDMRRHRDK